MNNTLLSIGKITGIHGLKGNLKIWSFAESIDTFGKGREIWLKSENDPTGTAYTLVEASPRNKGLVIRLKDVDNPDLAQALVGKEILINREVLPELEKEEWYWEDLYGLTVIDREQGRLGIVEGIFSTNAHDILVVTHKDPDRIDGTTGSERNGESEILIPMHDHFVESVDMEAKIIKTTLPEGYPS